MNLPKTSIETDSFVAAQIIEKKRTLSFDSLQYMAEKVEGTFTFTVLDQDDGLWFVKGDNPICIYCYPGMGLYLYASTEDILRRPFGGCACLASGRSRSNLRRAAADRHSREAGEGQFHVHHLASLWYAWPYSRCAGVCAPGSTDTDAEYLRAMKYVAATFG